MSSNCPSDRLGLCEVSKECYAKTAERMYPDCLPFRERQRKVFDTVSAEDIALALLRSSARAKKHKMLNFRFSEAGDFEDQADVEKLTAICGILKENGVKCYGYTARTDLDLSGLLKVARVAVSNDLFGWHGRGANRFKAVPEFTGKALRCVGDCSLCSLCARLTNKLIEVEIH